MTSFLGVDVGQLLYASLKNSSVPASIERVSYTPDSDVLSAGSTSSVFYACRAILSVSTETDAKTTLSTAILNASVLSEGLGVVPVIGDSLTVNAGRYVGRTFRLTKVESTDVGGVYRVRGSES